MKSLKYIMFTAAMFLLSGCEFMDEMFKFEPTVQDKKKQYSKPFNVEFQDEDAPKQALITANCKYNEPVSYTYYETQEDAHANYFRDTKNLISIPWNGKALKPYWDIRYVNSVDKYVNSSDNEVEYADLSLMSGIDARNGVKNVIVGSDMAKVDYSGSSVSAKCIDSVLAAGATINLNDAPEQYIEYAGPHATFIYRLADREVTMPWGNKDGNLMIQAHFNTPIYTDFSKNMGASVSFGVMLRNKKNGQQMNYIIGVYSAGDAWTKEQAALKYDPTTQMVHVATVASDKSWWSTKSPKSESITKILSSFNSVANKDDWNNFYRVNISYNNLKAVLHELKNNPPAEASGEEFGSNPEDWQVQSIMIQYEVEEEGGKAILSGSFKGFEAYSSKLPL